MKFYTFKKDVPLKPGEKVGYQRGRGYYAIPAPVPIRPNPQPGPSVFAGKGLFTTSEPGACAGRPANWIALQADPEGNTRPPQTNARICWWQARPTLDVIQQANQHGIPYIGQAESEPEIRKCLELGPKILVPKALVGNLRLLTSLGLGGKASEQGWDGISEWYWNAHPWEQGPDGGDYSRFVNVCFGIYSEGDPGGDGHIPQSKTVADYRAVWHGSFSVWRAESMTAADWTAFGA